MSYEGGGTSQHTFHLRNSTHNLVMVMALGGIYPSLRSTVPSVEYPGEEKVIYGNDGKEHSNCEAYCFYVHKTKDDPTKVGWIPLYFGPNRDDCNLDLALAHSSRSCVTEYRYDTRYECSSSTGTPTAKTSSFSAARFSMTRTSAW